MAEKEEADDITSLTDDVFNDSPAPEPEREPEPEPEQAPEEGDEKGAAEEESSEDVEPPSTEKPSGLVPEAALLDERRKRQELERKLREKESQAPDPVDDPEGYEAHLKTQVWANKVENSRELMMDLHTDYEEKEAIFMRMVRDEEGNVIDPRLVAQMNAARNPAKFAYEKATEFQEAEKYRDPAKREALITEEVAKRTAELEARLAALEGKKPQGVSPTQLPNLTKATAAGSNSPTPASSGETVDELFDS